MQPLARCVGTHVCPPPVENRTMDLEFCGFDCIDVTHHDMTSLRASISEEPRTMLFPSQERNARAARPETSGSAYRRRDRELLVSAARCFFALGAAAIDYADGNIGSRIGTQSERTAAPKSAFGLRTAESGVCIALTIA